MRRARSLILAGWCCFPFLVQTARGETHTDTNPLALPDRGAVIGFSPTLEDGVAGYEFAQPPGRIHNGEHGVAGRLWRLSMYYSPLSNTNWGTPGYFWQPLDDYIVGSEIIEYSLEDLQHVPDLSELADKYSVSGDATPVVFATTSQGRTTLMPDVRLEKGVERLLLQASYKTSGSWQTFTSSEGFMLAIRAGEPIEVQYTVPPDYPAAIVSSFKLPTSGEPVILPRGVHFFGVLAAFYHFPPWPSATNNNPWSSGQDAIALAVSLVPVKVKGASHSGGKFTFEWSDRADRAVDVQRTTSLSSGVWSTVSPNNSSKSFTDTNSPSGNAFYRVVVP